jgi:hypothetical protein
MRIVMHISSRTMKLRKRDYNRWCLLRVKNRLLLATNLLRQARLPNDGKVIDDTRGTGG